MKKIKTNNQGVVINLFGGPGIGKTTICHAVLAQLKTSGIKSDYAREYAKGLIYTENNYIFEHQILITAQQNLEVAQMVAHNDMVVTDCPLLLGIQYKSPDYFPDTYEPLVKAMFNEYKNINILLTRAERTFEKSGRIHNEDESKEIDKNIKRMLNEYGEDYLEVESISENIPKIINYAIKKQKEFNSRNKKTSESEFTI